MRNIPVLYKNLHSRFISSPYILATLFLLFLTIRKYVSPKNGNLREFKTEKIAVIYSYGENLGNGGIIDESNLSFLIQVGMRGNVPGTRDPSDKVDYIIVANGYKCTPCDNILPKILSLPELRRKESGWVTVLRRRNLGMDFGGFMHAIQWIQMHRRGRYKYYIFLNSSLRGPFMPKWTPENFHFTDVLLDRMRKNENLKLMGAYISCLPEIEPKPGPVMESLFFALDNLSLAHLVSVGIFDPQKAKRDSILLSEYRLLSEILSRGWSADTLLARYRANIDWTSKTHHRCNDNRHSSRRGALEGDISVNIYEAIFVKITWCVRAKEVAVTSKWLLQLSNNYDGTEGTFDRLGYENGISIGGTSGKNGTLRPDVPQDGCYIGEITDILFG